MNTIDENKFGVKTHIKNPKTNRLIRIGGRIYNDLVKNNLLNTVEQNRVIYEGLDKAEIDRVGVTVMKYENKINPPSNNKYFAKRNNKIFERKKTISRIDLTNDIQRRSLDLYLKHKHLFSDDMSTDEISSILNTLLHKDLAGLSTEIKVEKKFILGDIPQSGSDVDSDYEADSDDNDSDYEADSEENEK